MQVSKQQLEWDVKLQTGSCILLPCLFSWYVEYIIRNVRLDEAQPGVKIARRNNNNLRYADDATLMAVKGCCWITTPGFLAPRGEEFNPGPETRLDCSELLCNRVLLKYKGERESFWHRHQKGAGRVPPLLVFSWMLYSHQQSVNERKECLKT